MNKISKDALFWSTQVHAGSTARMLYFSGLAAIKWLTLNHPERSKKIVVYGFSMGGMAAINLGASEGLDAVTRAIAEAPANVGIGLPDKLLKPVSIFYGAQDNYGGLSIDEFLWKRRSSCLWGAPIENTPAGNAEAVTISKTKEASGHKPLKTGLGSRKAKGRTLHSS
jgi:S-formylglutathione hydrolase FrmB